MTLRELERAAAAKIARDHALNWPTSVFRPEGTTVDAGSARFARAICENIALEIEAAGLDAPGAQKS